MLAKRVGLLKSKFGGNPYNDSYTKLRLAFENNLTDTSSGASETHTPTNYGVTFSSITKKVGGYSSYFQHTPSVHATYPDSVDFNFEKDPFTIHFWVYMTVSGSRQGILSTAYGSGIAGGWCVFLESDNTIRFYYNINVSTTFLSGSFSGLFDQWVHVAIVRTGIGVTDTKLYINGTVQDSGIGDYTINTIAYPLQIGQLYYSGVLPYYRLDTGYIDALYIDNGIARWTSDFVTPTQ